MHEDVLVHKERHLGVTLQQRQSLSDLRGDHVRLGSSRKILLWIVETSVISLEQINTCVWRKN